MVIESALDRLEKAGEKLGHAYEMMRLARHTAAENQARAWDKLPVNSKATVKDKEQASLVNNLDAVVIAIRAEIEWEKAKIEYEVATMIVKAAIAAME